MKRKASHLAVAVLVIAVPLVLSASCTQTRSLESTVESKLSSDPSVRSARIIVETRGNVVTLSGNVDSQEVKDRAMDLARSVEGVVSVEDMISVRTADRLGDAPEPDRSVGERIDDATITIAVKARLLSDPLVKGTKIDVDTREGVVYLTGTVRSANEKHKAIELARETDHVKAVEANLDVRS